MYMKKIKIVSDSSSDILESAGLDFAYASMKIITSEKEFVDNSSLDINEMVTFLESYKGRSQTSCPNAEDWLNAFGSADDVICVTITSGLSGSYNTACAAKRIYEEDENKRVFVLDSLSTGPEMALIIEKLEELIRNGLPYEEICEKIQAYTKQTGLLFMLKSLKNLANNGRVSPAMARLLEMIGICIVGKASDEGKLDTTHKCKGENRSLETLIRDLKGYGVSSGKISIAHCQNEEGALKLQALIKKEFPDAKSEIHPLRGLCSFYAEKGGILVGFEKF
jgi:DegV family protein with EDD domain